MGTVKGVVFDFGNVLCGLDRMAFAREAAKRSPLGAEEIDAALWGGELEHDFETGKYDSRAYFSILRERFSFDAGYQYEAFAADFARIILPYPDGEEGLRYAAGLGLRTFVLSNTSFLHARCIFDNETLASIPEFHILSYKVGAMKPDPAIWRAFLRQSGMDPGECLYVDDVPKYCEAARSLGFRALHFDKSRENLRNALADVLIWDEEDRPGPNGPAHGGLS